MPNAIRPFIAAAAAVVFLWKIIAKLKDLKKECPHTPDPGNNPGRLAENKVLDKARRRVIRSELIRLIIDAAIFFFFMLSSAYDAYFRLFSFVHAEESPSGYFFAWSWLVTLTLFISLITDWIRMRRDTRDHVLTADEKWRFFQMELVSILYIEAGMLFIQASFLLLRFLPDRPPLKILVPVSAALLYRLIVYLIQRFLKKKRFSGGSPENAASRPARKGR